jgi:hypothetical protein
MLTYRRRGWRAALPVAAFTLFVVAAALLVALLT